MYNGRLSSLEEGRNESQKYCYTLRTWGSIARALMSVTVKHFDPATVNLVKLENTMA